MTESDTYCGEDMENYDHSKDHPIPVDEEAIARIMMLLQAAEKEINKMSSDCLCFKHEELYDLQALISDASHKSMIVGRKHTDLDSTFLPDEEDVANLVETTREKFKENND